MLGGLRPDVVEFIVKAARHEGATRVLLYGSRARGDYWERSDIDLAVEGANAMALAELLQEEAPTLLRFDVVDLGRLSEGRFRDSVLRDGVVLCDEREG